MAIADTLMDLFTNDWLGGEKAQIANDAVDSAIAFLINADITTEQFAAIDLECLDISDPVTCVLGQLFNGYDVGLDALRLPLDDMAVCEYGFCRGVIKGIEIDSALLTEVWRNKLRELRGA